MTGCPGQTATVSLRARPASSSSGITAWRVIVTEIHCRTVYFRPLYWRSARILTVRYSLMPRVRVGRVTVIDEPFVAPDIDGWV
jgi:hypothetical protein